MENIEEIATTYFKKYDKDRSNFIDVYELRKIMYDVAKDLGFPEPEESEVKETLKQYDENSDNRMSLEEFMAFFKVIYSMKNN